MHEKGDMMRSPVSTSILDAFDCNPGQVPSRSSRPFRCRQQIMPAAPPFPPDSAHLPSFVGAVRLKR